jgi:hypothetical protein
VRTSGGLVLYLEQNSARKATKSSDRNFGLFLSFIASCLVVYFIITKNQIFSIVFFSLHLTFLVVSIKFEKFLVVPNHLWFKLSQLLGRISNPMILGIVYLILVTPMALILKIFKRDKLNLNNDFIKSNWNLINSDSNKLNFRNQF